VSVMMLGTLINIRRCVRGIVPEGTPDARWQRPGIDSGANDEGERNQDNQTSEQY
jgi:hypothetical protein